MVSVNQDAFDGVASLEVDLDTYLTTERSCRDSWCRVPPCVWLGVIGTWVATPETGVGLCVAVFMIVFVHKSVEGPCGVFAPGNGLPYVFLLLLM